MEDLPFIKKQARLQSALLAPRPRIPGLAPSPVLGADGVAIYISKWRNGLIRRAVSVGKGGVLRSFKTEGGVSGAPRAVFRENLMVWSNITYYIDRRPQLRVSTSVRPGASLFSIGFAERTHKVQQSLVLSLDFSSFRDKGTVQALAVVDGEHSTELDIGELDMGPGVTLDSIRKQLTPVERILMELFRPVFAEYEQFGPLFAENVTSKEMAKGISWKSISDPLISDLQFRELIVFLRNEMPTVDNISMRAIDYGARWAAITSKALTAVGCIVIGLAGGGAYGAGACAVGREVLNGYIDIKVKEIEDAERRIEESRRRTEELNRQYEELIQRLGELNQDPQANAQQIEETAQQCEETTQQCEEATQQIETNDQQIEENTCTDTSVDGGSYSEGGDAGSYGGYSEGGDGGDGDGGGGGCFPASTLVATWGSPVPLGSLEVGDMIPGYDLESGESLSQQVLSTSIHRHKTVLSLDFGSEMIVCTPRQPFFTGTWTPASQLRSGDKVLRRDGMWQELKDEPREAGQCDVDNLHVVPSQSYYVGAAQLLVHNKDIIYSDQSDGDGDGWW